MARNRSLEGLKKAFKAKVVVVRKQTQAIKDGKKAAKGGAR